MLEVRALLQDSVWLVITVQVELAQQTRIYAQKDINVQLALVLQPHALFRNTRIAKVKVLAKHAQPVIIAPKLRLLYAQLDIIVLLIM